MTNMEDVIDTKLRFKVFENVSATFDFYQVLFKIKVLFTSSLRQQKGHGYTGDKAQCSKLKILSYAC